MDWNETLSLPFHKTQTMKELEERDRNMLQLIELIKMFKNTKAGSVVNNIILVLILVIAGYYMQVEIIEPLKNYSYDVYTYDMYRYVEFDLMKQKEKLLRDTADMKVSDILKFDYYCNSYFGKEYLESLPADRSRPVEAVCEIINDLYKKNMAKVDL